MVVDWSDVTSGVPKGSVIWLALLLIYINDQSDVVEVLMNIFANDVK